MKYFEIIIVKDLIDFLCLDVHIVILINEFQFSYIIYLGSRLCHVSSVYLNNM